MTELEKFQHDTIMMARELLAAGESRKKCNYMMVMDLIRKSISRYQNKCYGCATGLHSGACTCKAAKLGISKDCGYFVAR